MYVRGIACCSVHTLPAASGLLNGCSSVLYYFCSYPPLFLSKWPFTKPLAFIHYARVSSDLFYLFLSIGLLVMQREGEKDEKRKTRRGTEVEAARVSEGGKEVAGQPPKFNNDEWSRSRTPALRTCRMVIIN